MRRVWGAGFLLCRIDHRGFRFRYDLSSLAQECNRLIGGLEGPVSAAFLEIRFAFCKQGIDSPPLRRRVLVVGRWELRAVDHYLAGQDFQLLDYRLERDQGSRADEGA